MANKKKSVPFIKKRFEYALERAGYTKSAFSKEVFPSIQDSLRKLQKYMEAQEIPPDVLDVISEKLDISPDYFSGSYSVTKNELQTEFGSEFSLYFTDNDFDPEGYNFYSYYDYQKMQKQMPIDEHLISFLNTELYAVYRTPFKVHKLRFDFHDLDHNELYDLEEKIYKMVEKSILKCPNKSWREFVDTTKKKWHYKDKDLDS